MKKQRSVIKNSPFITKTLPVFILRIARIKTFCGTYFCEFGIPAKIYTNKVT